MSGPMHSKKRGQHYSERGAVSEPCAQCPFKKNSMKGYIGPWSRPEDIISQAFSEGGFACHMTLNSKDPRKYRVCAGSLICANKSAKLFRDVNLRRLQVQVEDTGNVMGMREFCEYHKQ